MTPSYLPPCLSLHLPKSVPSKSPLWVPLPLSGPPPAHRTLLIGHIFGSTKPPFLSSECHRKASQPLSCQLLDEVLYRMQNEIWCLPFTVSWVTFSVYPIPSQSSPPSILTAASRVTFYSLWHSSAFWLCILEMQTGTYVNQNKANFEDPSFLFSFFLKLSLRSYTHTTELEGVRKVASLCSRV